MRIPDGSGSTIEVPDLDTSRPANEVERDAVCFFLETNRLSLFGIAHNLGREEARLIAEYLGLLVPRIQRGEHIARVQAAWDRYGATSEKH